MNRMASIDRQADLHFAYQFGQDVARGDIAAAAEFDVKFAGDIEAVEVYRQAFDDETARLKQVANKSTK